MNICASFVFKAESEPNNKKTFFEGFFFKTQKHTFGGLKNWFQTLKFKLYFCACSLMKNEGSCQFSSKNINI